MADLKDVITLQDLIQALKSVRSDGVSKTVPVVVTTGCGMLGSGPVKFIGHIGEVGYYDDGDEGMMVYLDIDPIE